MLRSLNEAGVFNTGQPGFEKKKDTHDLRGVRK